VVEANSMPPSTEKPGTGHELSDLDPKRIALFAVTLAVIIVGVILAAYALFRSFATVEIKRQVTPSPLSSTREPTPGPRLIVNSGQDLKAMRAAENATLHSYGWVNRGQGVVRIPIDRAIDMLAARGLPARPAGNKIPTDGGKPKRTERK
jgi:hypothetical protein